MLIWPVTSPCSSPREESKTAASEQRAGEDKRLKETNECRYRMPAWLTFQPLLHTQRARPRLQTHHGEECHLSAAPRNTSVGISRHTRGDSLLQMKIPP